MGVFGVKAADFYRKEAMYWRAEADRLKEILEKIVDVAAERHYKSSPPEPPIGTRYFHGTAVTWYRDAKGWNCALSICKHCPTDWAEAWEYGISRDDVCVLPDD
jgi:hypothetical protein